jgi:hypothetical protein
MSEKTYISHKSQDGEVIASWVRCKPVGSVSSAFRFPQAYRGSEPIATATDTFIGEANGKHGGFAADHSVVNSK